MALRNRAKEIREDADKGLVSVNEVREEEGKAQSGGILGRNRERLEELEENREKPAKGESLRIRTQERAKKATAIQKRKKKDDPTITALRAVLGELESDIKPKRLKFLLEYVNNGFIGWRAYKTVYPHVKKNTAKFQAGQWLKDISMSDMLLLCGFGYERIMEDLDRLSPERRMHYLMKLHKLDHKEVEHTGKLEISVVAPPRSDPSESSTKGSESPASSLRVQIKEEQKLLEEEKE